MNSGAAGLALVKACRAPLTVALTQRVHRGREAVHDVLIVWFGYHVALLGALLVPGAALAKDGPQLTGTVTRDGAPVRGADVYVAAWPTPDDLHALPAGAEVVLSRFKPVKTGPTGQFAVDVSALPSDYLMDNGVANLEVTVIAYGEFINWGLPPTVDVLRQQRAELLSADAAGLPAVASASGDGVPTTADLRIETGVKPGVGLPGDAQRSWKSGTAGTETQLTKDGLLPVAKGQAASEATDGGIAPMGVTSGSSCPAATGYFTKTGTMKYGVSEKFARAMSTSRAPITSHQAYGSSHTLGMAFQNTSGSWSQSGTYSYQEKYGGSGDVSGLVDKWVINAVNYAQYRCGRLYTNALLGYAWLPDSINAIASNVTTSSGHVTFGTGSPRCAAYASGAVMTKTQGTNVTWSAGVGFSPISLSAQAGWSADTSLAWHIVGNVWLCGSTDSGWFPSAEAEAHNR